MADILGLRTGSGSLWTLAVEAALDGMARRVAKQEDQVARLAAQNDALAADLASIKNQGGAVAEEDHG